MIRPELLSIYLKLCDTLSFSKTAEALHIPRSTVSDSLKRLEEDLNIKLLKRTTRKVQVTDEGKVFYEKAQTILNDLLELENLFTNEDESFLQGRIRVDMPIGIARHIVLPNISEFKNIYPGIDIELSSTDRRVDPIAEGFDFIIRVGSLQDSSLIVRKVAEHSIINCVSQSYIDKYGKPTSLNSLKDHYQIHYLQNIGVGKDGFEYFEEGKFKIMNTKSLVTVNNSIAYTEAALAGLGIIQAPILGISHYLESGELVQVLKKYKAEAMGIYFVYPHREHIPKRVQVFMKWCESLIKELSL